jgi:hypothetical protein
MLFNKRFTAAWAADGYRDYLSPEQRRPETGKAVLTRLLKGATTAGAIAGLPSRSAAGSAGLDSDTSAASPRGAWPVQSRGGGGGGGPAAGSSAGRSGSPQRGGAADQAGFDAPSPRGHSDAASGLAARYAYGDVPAASSRQDRASASAYDRLGAPPPAPSYPAPPPPPPTASASAGGGRGGATSSYDLYGLAFPQAAAGSGGNRGGAASSYAY